jgi:hypothetical protein
LRSYVADATGVHVEGRRYPVLELAVPMAFGAAVPVIVQGTREREVVVQNR